MSDENEHIDDVPTTPTPLPPAPLPPRLRRTERTTYHHDDDTPLEKLHTYITHTLNIIDRMFIRYEIKQGIEIHDKSTRIYNYIMDPLELASRDEKIKELTVLIGRVKSFISESIKKMFAIDEYISDIIMDLEEYLPFIEKGLTDAKKSITTGIPPTLKTGFVGGYYKKYMKYKSKYQKLKKNINEKRNKSKNKKKE